MSHHDPESFMRDYEAQQSVDSVRRSSSEKHLERDIRPNWVISTKFREYVLKGIVSGILAILWLAFAAAYLKGDSADTAGTVVLLILAGYWLAITVGYVHGYTEKRRYEASRMFHNDGTRTCPYCSERIKADAKVCRYCHRSLAKTRWPYLVLGTLLLIAVYSRNWRPKETPAQSGDNTLSAAPRSTEAVCNEQTSIQQAKQSSHLVALFDRTGNMIESGSSLALTNAVSGVLLTNYHVIADYKKYTLRVWDGFDGKEWVNASVYRAYPDQDIALIQVADAFPITTVLQDSDQLADAATVYAVGWPNDPSGEATITKGILSRRMTDSGRELLQTDATINPGNSGGPLVSACGIVGMNTEKLVWTSQLTPAEGTGFALSSNFISKVIYK